MIKTIEDSFIDTIKAALLQSFLFYADPKMTGYDPVRPVSKITFSAHGEITSPPDLDFMGYGSGSEGDAFSECGGINLEAFFPLNQKGEFFESDSEEYIDKCLQKASAEVLKCLKSISTSDEFQNIPKNGPIVFGLNLIDQQRKTICRIHPNGEIEQPPNIKTHDQ